LKPFVTQPICSGDQIATGGQNGTVTVLRTDETRVSYRSGTGPVAAPQQPSSRWATLVTALSGLSKSVEPYGSYNFVGRDAQKLDFSIYALKTNSARVGTGHRNLYIRWSGGVQPFALILSDPQHHQTIASTAGIPGNAVYLNLQNELAPGQSSIALKDSSGMEARGGFQVDASHHYQPAQPGPFAEVQIAADAVALSDDAPWALEADQMLAAAPGQGLDRGPVLKSIACKSHGMTLPPDC
jgi:hypothetical protein